MMRKSRLFLVLTMVAIGLAILFSTILLTKTIAFQWDIGNFTVGVATLAVAAVSFFVALSTNSQMKDRIQIEVSGLWIEEMRKALSAYIGTINAVRKSEGAAEKARLLALLTEQETYLRLKFDLSDPEAERLFALLDRVRNSLSASDGAIDQITAEIVQNSRGMFERRWTSEMARLRATL